MRDKLNLMLKSTLMTKLMSWFLILIIVPLSVVGLITYNRSKSALREQAEKNLDTTLNSAVKELRLEMINVQNIMRIMSNSDYIVKIADEMDSGKISQDTLSAVHNKITASKVSIGDMCEEVSIVDKNGNSIVSSNSTKGINISSRDYFQRSISGEPCWSDVITSMVTENPVISYSVPLKTSNGKIAGVLFVTEKFEGITEVLSHLKVGETGYAYMIDKNGLILYYPQKDKILKENLLQSSANNKQLNSLLDKMTKGYSGKGIYTYAGVNKIVIYRPISKWSVAITLPVNEYMSAVDEIRNMTLLVAFVAVALSIVIAVLASKRTIKPIKYLIETMEKVSKGDLSVEVMINTKDEIGALANSFNSMINEQRNIIEKIMDSASNVGSASEECSSVSEEMSSSSQNQTLSVMELKSAMGQMSKSVEEVANKISDIAGKINSVTDFVEKIENDSENMILAVNNTNETITDVTSSIEEMNATIEIVANNANVANNEAKKTVEVTKEGKITVENTVQEMDNINLAMLNLTEVIKGLGKAAVQIGDIVEVIDDIAEQTNLLALNAAIEAARAGEHGKGFAVVAGAIGNLAEKSGEATKDITSLIKHIQDELENAIKTTDAGAEKVRNGVGLVQRTGNVLDNIFQDIDNTTKLINEIALSTTEQSKASKVIMDAVEKVNMLSIDVSAIAQNQGDKMKKIMDNIEKINMLSQGVASAAEEQSAGSEEILATVESVGEMSTQVSSGSEEVASTAQSLAVQAEELINIVSKFKI